MTGDTPASAAGALEAAGLKEVYRLSLMATASGGSRDDRVKVVEGDDVARVAEFVVDQFFWSHPVPFRHQISRISLRAGAAGRQIFLAIEGDAGLLGAATLFRSEHSVGIYNVCVRASHRGSGIGRALVAHGMALASDISPKIVLQCDPGLVGWYRDVGFSEVGESLTLSTG
jgi:ribosomal protein S18 acetylase RimI-like enzyme